MENTTLNQEQTKRVTDLKLAADTMFKTCDDNNAKVFGIVFSSDLPKVILLDTALTQDEQDTAMYLLLASQPSLIQSVNKALGMLNV